MSLMKVSVYGHEHPVSYVGGLVWVDIVSRCYADGQILSVLE